MVNFRSISSRVANPSWQMAASVSAWQTTPWSENLHTPHHFASLTFKWNFELNFKQNIWHHSRENEKLIHISNKSCLKNSNSGQLMQNWHNAYIAEICGFLQYLVLFCPLKIGSHFVLPESLCRTYISSFPFYILPFVFVFDKDGVSILLGSCARQGGETPGSDLSDGRQAEKLYFTLLCCYDLFFVSIVFLLLSLLYFI